jgi:hypothetical protein
MRTDAELLADDFGAFYERHVDTVTAYLARRTRRPEQAFDLVAETFARALEHRRRYDAARGPAIAWLLGVSDPPARVARAGRAAEELVSCDPFEVLKDRLVKADRPRRRFGVVVPIAIVLGVSASAAAALTLKSHPSQPVKTARYVVEVMPDLDAGAIGWCGSVTIRGVTGGRGCSSSGPPGSHLLVGGALASTRGDGVAYAVVDPAVKTVVFGSRRVEPRADPSVPAPWRVAVAPARGETIVLLDARGHRISEPAFAGRDPRGEAVDPQHPPDVRCAIHAAALVGLRAVSARVLTRVASRPTVAPAYLSCATTVYYLGRWRVRAAVLLNATDPEAPAPPLPPNRFLDARRVGNGWLVVFGADAVSRRRVLAALYLGKRP